MGITPQAVAGRLAAQGVPLPSLPLSHKDPESSLSAYDMRCVLVLAEKERPPAGPRGLGISAGTTTAAYRSSLLCFLFIFHHPTPHLKGRHGSVPGSHHLSNRLYFCDSVLARRSVWGQSV